MSCNTPVLLLVFNRPHHTRVTLDRIRLAAPARMYVHCDGPRGDKPGETDQVEAVRSLIRQGIDWDCKVEYLFREQNIGLRDGLYGALNWFFETEPYGIILEDDCVPDLSFFSFCEELLLRYQDDEQIMHIGGSNLAERYTATKPASYMFSRFSFVWGWASWRRAWQSMSLNLNGLEEFEASGYIRDFMPVPMAQVYMLDKFRVTQQRKNNSWAYAWFYSILKNNGLCIVPKTNLVQNVGVGEEGATNTTGRNETARKKSGNLQFPLIHPPDRSVDMELEKHFFYTSQKKRFRLLLWGWFRGFRKV